MASIFAILHSQSCQAIYFGTLDPKEVKSTTRHRKTIMDSGEKNKNKNKTNYRIELAQCSNCGLKPTTPAETGAIIGTYPLSMSGAQSCRAM